MLLQIPLRQAMLSSGFRRGIRATSQKMVLRIQRDPILQTIADQNPVCLLARSNPRLSRRVRCNLPIPRTESREENGLPSRFLLTVRSKRSAAQEVGLPVQHPMERIGVWGQKKKQAIPRTVLVGEHYPMSISPTVIPIGFINPDPKDGCALRGDL